MNNLKKIVAIVSVLGLGSVLSAPAYAGSVQAYASGSSAIVLMNGASQSVGAEIALPSGSSFKGATATGTGATAASEVGTEVLCEGRDSKSRQRHGPPFPDLQTSRCLLWLVCVGARVRVCTASPHTGRLCLSPVPLYSERGAQLFGRA